MSEKSAQTMQKNSTRKVALMAMFTAISVVLVYAIRFPMFLPFLEYNPSDIPILIATFTFGPQTGLLLTILVSVLQGITVSAQSGIVGIVMHIVATASFVVSAGFIYKKRNDNTGVILALVGGSLVMTVMMVLWNLLLTPYFMNVSRDMVDALIVPAIIPFNLVKSTINCGIAYVLLKPIKALLAKINK